MTESLIKDSNNVRSSIENNYPNPIAAVYRRYFHTEAEDLTGRLFVLINLSEVIVKFLSIVQLQEGRKFVPNFREKLPDGPKTFEFLRQPSFGHWTGLLRMLSKVDISNTGTVWMPRINDWYYQSRNDENILALKYLREYQGSNEGTGSKKPISEICDALPNLRNKFAHRAKLTDEEVGRRVQLLEATLTLLLKSASFLEEMLLLYVERIEKAKNDKWQINYKKLRGASEPEPRKCVCKDLLELSEMYLADKSEGELEGNVVSMTPFLNWRFNEERKRHETYFYNDTFRTKLEYLSYTSGSVYLHPELHSAFSELVDLKQETQTEEDKYSSLTEDERSERAEDLYNRALIFLQQDRLQNALEYLDQAIIYRRRADVFLKMAEIMQRLEEPSESVRQVLQKCLDIEPENIEARRLLSRLPKNETEDIKSDVENIESENLFDESDPRHKIANQDVQNSKIGQAKQFTVFHLFCPQSLVNLAVPLWVVSVCAWYFISSAVELLLQNVLQMTATLLLLVCCVIVIFVAAVLRSWAERLRYPLRVQVKGKEKERFDKWFDRQIDLMFGSFCVDSQKIQVADSIKKESLLYKGSILWITALTAGAIFFTRSYEVSLPLVIKRIVDYALVFTLLYAGARYTIAVTMFVSRFSKLPLKPMLTRISNDGVRSLGPFISFNIAVSILIYCILHLSFALNYKHPFLGDLFFLCIGTSIIAVWTIAFPFQLRRTLQASKSPVIYEYSDHIEKAFKAFLENPNDENEKWYQRILEKQRIIKDISVWALSPAETIFIIGGGNLLLAIVFTAYVVNRLGLWATVNQYFRHLWQ